MSAAYVTCSVETYVFPFLDGQLDVISLSVLIVFYRPCTYHSYHNTLRFLSVYFWVPLGQAVRSSHSSFYLLFISSSCLMQVITNRVVRRYKVTIRDIEAGSYDGQKIDTLKFCF